jgi:hypothetical protein
MNEGNLLVFERPFFLSNPFSDTIALNFMRHHRFIFQPEEYLTVKLPGKEQITAQTGLWDSSFLTSFEIGILISRWAASSINLQGVNGTVMSNWNGNIPKDNSAVDHNYGNINLGKGNSATLYYYNETWYITGLQK